MLLILAGVIASAGIADLAGCGLNEICSGDLSDRYGACIGVTDRKLLVCYYSPPGFLFDSTTGGFWMGFGYYRSHTVNSAWSYFVIFCPFWFPVLVLATYPAIAFIRGPFRHWRRKRRGLCLSCAYNLEGNVSGRCPECGAAFEKASKTNDATTPTDGA